MSIGATSPAPPQPTQEKRQPNRVHSELEEGHYKVTQGLRPHGSDGGSDTSALKTAADGQTVLIPQPSDDPDDPLNWSWLKKHTVFLSMIPGCLLADFVIT
jgi:hypothetical protein